MYFGKLGQRDVLKGLIIATMSILIIIFILATYYDLQVKKFDEDTCQASVNAHKLLAERGIDITGAELNCPTEYNTIKYKDKMDIQYAIADEMVDCWDDFGRGESILFDDEMVYCSVCNVIDFKDKDISIDGFTTFLGTRLIPGKDVTYMDYLMNYETPQTKEYLDDPSIYDQSDDKLKNQIDTSKNYSIVFVYAKGEKKIAQLKEYVGGKALVGTFVGIGVGQFLGGVTALIIMATPVGWVGGTAIAVAGGIMSITAGTWAGFKAYFVGEEDYHLSFVMLKEHNPQEFEDLKCDYYPSVQHTYTEKNK